MFNGFPRPKKDRDGVSLILTAGDNYFAGTTTITNTSSGTYTKLKEVSINASGSIRVKFDLKCNSVNAFGRVYKNGVAVGLERSTTSTSYVTFSEDFTVSPGDLIQIYSKTDTTAYVTNFKLYTGIEFISTTFTVD